MLDAATTSSTEVSEWLAGSHEVNGGAGMAGAEGRHRGSEASRLGVRLWKPPPVGTFKVNVDVTAAQERVMGFGFVE